MKRHFLPVAMLATMMLVGMVLPVYAAENQENEETITRIVVSEKEVQDSSSSFLALATEGEAVQTAKTKIAAKEKAEKALNAKYEQLSLQFASYGAIINQMEASFSGLKLMIQQSTAS